MCKHPVNVTDVYDAIENKMIHANNSVVHYEKCRILVVANVSDKTYTADLPCLYGYQYEEKQDTSLISDVSVIDLDGDGLNA